MHSFGSAVGKLLTWDLIRPENFELGPGLGFILWARALFGPGSLFSKIGLGLGLLLNKENSQARREKTHVEKNGRFFFSWSPPYFVK
jgi:hypothetical protein